MPPLLPVTFSKLQSPRQHCTPAPPKLLYSVLHAALCGVTGGKTVCCEGDTPVCGIVEGAPACVTAPPSCSSSAHARWGPGAQLPAARSPDPNSAAHAFCCLPRLPPAQLSACLLWRRAPPPCLPCAATPSPTPTATHPASARPATMVSAEGSPRAATTACGLQQAAIPPPALHARFPNAPVLCAPCSALRRGWWQDGVL